MLKMINLENSFLGKDLEEEIVRNYIFESNQNNIILKNVTFEKSFLKKRFMIKIIT